MVPSARMYTLCEAGKVLVWLACFSRLLTLTLGAPSNNSTDREGDSSFCQVESVLQSPYPSPFGSGVSQGCLYDIVYDVMVDSPLGACSAFFIRNNGQTPLPYWQLVWDGDYSAVDVDEAILIAAGGYNPSSQNRSKPPARVISQTEKSIRANGGSVNFTVSIKPPAVGNSSEGESSWPSNMTTTYRVFGVFFNEAECSPLSRISLKDDEEDEENVMECGAVQPGGTAKQGSMKIICRSRFCCRPTNLGASPPKNIGNPGNLTNTTVNINGTEVPLPNNVSTSAFVSLVDHLEAIGGWFKNSTNGTEPVSVPEPPVRRQDGPPEPPVLGLSPIKSSPISPPGGNEGDNNGLTQAKVIIITVPLAGSVLAALAIGLVIRARRRVPQRGPSTPPAPSTVQDPTQSHPHVRPTFLTGFHTQKPYLPMYRANSLAAPLNQTVDQWSISSKAISRSVSLPSHSSLALNDSLPSTHSTPSMDPCTSYMGAQLLPQSSGGPLILSPTYRGPYGYPEAHTLTGKRTLSFLENDKEGVEGANTKGASTSNFHVSPQMGESPPQMYGMIPRPSPAVVGPPGFGGPLDIYGAGGYGSSGLSEHPHIILEHEREGEATPEGAVSLCSDIWTRDQPADFEEVDFREIELEHKLGAGGFGQVYAARWRGDQVAVKMVPVLEGCNGSSFASGLKGLQQEVAVLSGLDHPNIIRFLGACLAPPHICIVEELALGGSLYQKIHSKANKKRGIKMPYREVIQVAMDVASAMAFLHPSIVHRDLKPQNVLLDLNGRAKVCDFGIAKYKDRTFLSTKNVHAGTPAYMAPELFEGKPVGERVDVFSFGVMLWECLTGLQPWADYHNPMQIIFAVGVLDQRLEIPGSCPEVIQKLIARCWEREPDDRPSFNEILPILEGEMRRLSYFRPGPPLVDRGQTSRAPAKSQTPPTSAEHPALPDTPLHQQGVTRKPTWPLSWNSLRSSGQEGEQKSLRRTTTGRESFLRTLSGNSGGPL